MVEFELVKVEVGAAEDGNALCRPSPIPRPTPSAIAKMVQRMATTKTILLLNLSRHGSRVFDCESGATT